MLQVCICLHIERSHFHSENLYRNVFIQEKKKKTKNRIRDRKIKKAEEQKRKKRKKKKKRERGKKRKGIRMREQGKEKRKRKKRKNRAIWRRGEEINTKLTSGTVGRASYLSALESEDTGGWLLFSAEVTLQAQKTKLLFRKSDSVLYFSYFKITKCLNFTRVPRGHFAFSKHSAIEHKCINLFTRKLKFLNYHMMLLQPTEIQLITPF